MKEADRQIELLKLANAKGMKLADIKAMLAGKVMDLRTQKELAGKDGKGPEVATPPNEPPGRAPNGEAYQQ
jgi:hypothetical protein